MQRRNRASAPAASPVAIRQMPQLFRLWKWSGLSSRARSKCASHRDGSGEPARPCPLEDWRRQDPRAVAERRRKQDSSSAAPDAPSGCRPARVRGRHRHSRHPESRAFDHASHASRCRPRSPSARARAIQSVALTGSSIRESSARAIALRNRQRTGQTCGPCLDAGAALGAGRDARSMPAASALVKFPVIACRIEIAQTSR